MRNRWFHVPTLHTALGDEKSVSWMELFYDLIFVASIIQLGDVLSSQVTQTHQVLGPLAGFLGMFVPLWAVWAGYSFFANRFTVDDVPQRVVVFAKMFAVGAMALTAPAVVLQGEHTAFALSFAVAQGLIALLYLRAWRQVPEARDYCTYWGGAFGIGALFWVVSAVVPTPWAYIFWGVGVAALVYTPVSERSRELAERYPLDMEHLSERFGLLTIIVLGESFIKVLSYLSASEYGMQAGFLMKASLGLLITCAVWWIYFDDVAGAEVRSERGSWVVWLFGHMPLAAGITALGVAVKKIITFELGAPPDEAYRWLVCATLALVFFSVALIDSVTEREHVELSDQARANVRFASVFFVLLVGAVGQTMSAGLFLAIITAICLGQIVFDIMIAPMEEEAQEIERAVSTSELARQSRDERAERREGQSRELGKPVRKGAPSELRRDLYFFFMEGSWTRLFFALGFVYLLVNCFFAGLFLLEPGSIAGAPDASFGEAFAFSIQTMSTIGYGAMNPATAYGDLIVAIEAAFSILGVALATGIMFAKASQPQSSVLFSEPMVLTEYEGQPTLMFRAGNARGSEVVEAKVNVSVLRDEITDEGHHIRRMHDLELVRERSPFFTLSWQVMHVIDDDSPLNDVDWDRPEADLLMFAVTMQAHEMTYSRATFARHVYAPEDIRVGHRFVDVLSETPDGDMVIDFTRFHDTEPVLDEQDSAR